ncbi:MAG: hypothetical protein GPJ14_20095, partial [Microcystis aeruginosa G11-01]|nr:hypothetical protein [Microcystis aeruginosa G11-01]
ATTERFVYGSNQNIALVFDGNGTLTHRYMFSNGIDQIEADEQLSTGTTLWALTDHLGSVRDVVDNSGVNQNHIVYDAFGNITSQTNSSVIFRNSYTGQEFDSESGLFNYGGRYYDGSVGRFISEDPIGFGGGDANLSRYVQNNSLSFVDPLGKNPINRILQRQDSIPPSGNILAIYDTRKSNLTLSDRETGKSLEVASFSGGGSREVPGSNPPRYEIVDKTYINDLSRANIEGLGTIPKGRYEIFRINDKPAYGYRLEAIDSIPRDDIDQNTIDPKSKRQRSQYRLHAFGNSSGGCITVKNLANPDESENSRRKRGDEVRKFIERTSKPYDDKSPISLWQRLLYGSKIYKYGELIVK